MVGVLSLSHTATLVAVETLLQHPPEIYSWLLHRIHRLLRSDYYSTVSGIVLERLCKYYPHKVTDDLLLSLAPPDLRRLHLVNCDKVTSLGIMKILEKCERLSCLGLQDCRCAGNLLCDSFPSTNSCTISESIDHPGYSLTILDLSRCELVTDSTIKNILQHVTSLKQLHLVACTGITDEVFLLDEKRQLMRNERNSQAYSCNLTAVDISSCNQLTSTAVRHLTTLSGPSLKCINISATSADCTALLFLSGYSMLTSLQITKQTDHSTLMDLAMVCDDLSASLARQCTTAQPSDTLEQASQVDLISPEAKPNVCDKESCTKSEATSDGISKYTNSHHESSDDILCSNCGHSTVTSHDTKCICPYTSSAAGVDHMSTPRDVNPTFQVQLLPVLDFRYAESGMVGERNCDGAMAEECCQLSGVSGVRDDRGTESKYSALGFASVSTHQCQVFPSQATTSSADIHTNRAPCPDSSASSKPGLPAVSEMSLPSTAGREVTVEQTLLSPVDSGLSDAQQSELSTDELVTSCDTYLTDNDKMTVDHETSQLPISDRTSHTSCRDHQSESDTSVQYPLVYQPNLEVVDLSYIEFGDRDTALVCLYHLLNRNSNIQQLSLSWKDLDDEILEKVIVQNAVQLKSISLVDCQALTTYGVAVLCDTCEDLSVLNLQGVNFIQDRGISGILANGHVTRLGLSETMITDYTLFKIASMCGDKVRDLDLSWCEEITEEGIIQVAKHCSSLHRCLLRRCPVTEEALHLLAKNCTNLRHLSISGINTLTDGHLVAIALKLKHLEYLDIGWNLEVTDVGLSALLRYSYTLQTLIATGVKQITSTPFWLLVSDVQAFRRCKALLLMERSLRDEKRGTNCVIISSDEDDDDVFSIPLRSTCYAPNLNQLQLEWCDCVSDSDLAEIALVCRGSLHITDYYGIKVEPAIVVNTKSR